MSPKNTSVDVTGVPGENLYRFEDEAMLGNGRFVFRAMPGIPAFNYQLANGNNERQMFADGDGELRAPAKTLFHFPSVGKDSRPERKRRILSQIAVRDAESPRLPAREIA